MPNLSILTGSIGGAYQKEGVAELSRRTGINRTTIIDYLKLLSLEPEASKAIEVL